VTAALARLTGYTLSMRSAAATLVSVLALTLGLAPAASGQGGGGSVTGGGGGSVGAGGGTGQRGAVAAVRALDGALNHGMRQAGNFSGADVVDLTTGRTLFSHNATTERLPASVEKLFTTTTALQRFGPTATLTTSLLGQGQQHGATFTGTLYLRGGGDPTFGSSAFDIASYGTGATMEQLVSDLLSSTGIRAFQGNVVADETMFDSDRGTPATGNQPSIDVEGELSALAYDRGWSNSTGTSFFPHPAAQAGRQLLAALQAAGVQVPRRARVTAGSTPATASTLAIVRSPSIATLVGLTNAPSDNFLAEMLVKDLGARFGAEGTTAAGAAVVRAQMADSFGIHPQLNDGSGLSRADLTTPMQVVTLLAQMANDAPFTGSLAVAGRTGTLQHEMRGTYAQGRCRGKTGTLHDVSNVVGYCHARDGHTLAFALMMNGIVPDYAHPIQDRMQVAVAKYGG
jgi:D-alanyl-D-alanine carboxypeptidase/D-alanyl-D-alanine-endopeptidase (penicillin-binding protein 4)